MRTLNFENGNQSSGRTITERYALATLVALVTIIILTLAAILILAIVIPDTNDTRISAVVGIAGPAIGGLLIMLQNAQVRSAIAGSKSDVQKEVAIQVAATSPTPVIVENPTQMPIPVIDLRSEK